MDGNISGEHMSDHEKLKQSVTQNEINEDDDFKEGYATRIADAIAGVEVGLTKTIKEIGVTPIRITGRMIDGGISGFKQGWNNSERIHEKMTHPILGMFSGVIKGVGEGFKKTANRINDGLYEIAESINPQINKTSNDKKRIKNKNMKYGKIYDTTGEPIHQ